MEPTDTPKEEQKLDSGLRALYRVWREDPERAAEDGGSVLLLFQGDLGAIEALGFETHSVFGDQALGVIRFKDIPAISALANVLWIAAGREPKRYLDTAVHDIKARASAPVTGAPVDGLWHADITNPVLTSVPKGTGKGVIIAIIDTGIDFTHPMFMNQLSPTVKTRILKIWDQGLTPASVSDCPDRRFLASADTYGVEFDSTKIETHLTGGATIDHRDCEAHGTHVAGIAAGGTKFIVGDASKVGVAPEADIIAVKYLDTPEKIFYKLQDGSVGTEVNWTARFRDAVLYCLRNARELNKPVVINMSFGDDAMPGDGLDDDARWVDSVMDPSHAPGDDNFPKGAVITKAAGNEADNPFVLMRIEVPPSGEIIVPLKLVDVRGTTQTRWQHCAQEYYSPTVSVHFWYRRSSAPLAVQFAVQLPNNNAFSADVSGGGKLELGFTPIVGPPPNDIATAFQPKEHGITIDHQNIPPVPHPAGGTVARSYVQFFVTPKESGGTISYHQGVYKIRIKAPPGTIVFGKGEEKFWTGGKAVILRLDDPPLPANITTPVEISMPDSLGQHVMTVASYTDLAVSDPLSSPRPAHGISDFSSRGPLRDYSDPPRPPFCTKPDIAAPGEDINSAESIHSEGLGLFGQLWSLLGLRARFQEMSGTSMAAPMIAGVVALMLEKNPNLNTADVRTALSSAPRPSVDPSTPPDSTNAYGVGMVDALTSHANTP
jgi:subtilisin family serine protease